MRNRKAADDRKTEIIDAALQLSDDVGPDRMTTAAVARAVGLSQPGVFRHFPRKQDLWQAVGARVAAMIEACWDRVPDDAAPLARLRALAGAQLRLIAGTPAIPAILFSRELHVENDALRGALFGCMTRFHDRLARLLDDARAAGELRDDLIPGDAAALVLGLIQGLALRWSLSGRAFDLSAEGERLLELQLTLFAPPRATPETPS